jgi:hypothetical protein
MLVDDDRLDQWNHFVEKKNEKKIKVVCLYVILSDILDDCGG